MDIQGFIDSAPKAVRFTDQPPLSVEQFQAIQSPDDLVAIAKELILVPGNIACIENASAGSEETRAVLINFAVNYISFQSAGVRGEDADYNVSREWLRVLRMAFEGIKGSGHTMSIDVEGDYNFHGSPYNIKVKSAEEHVLWGMWFEALQTEFSGEPFPNSRDWDDYLADCDADEKAQLLAARDRFLNMLREEDRLAF